MIQNVMLRNSFLVNEKVTDALFITIPEWVKDHLTVEILTLDGKSVIRKLVGATKNSMIKISTKTINKGQYVLSILSHNRYAATSFVIS